MSGFGSFIKKIEGGVNVNTIRETEGPRFWERDFDPVHTGAAEYSVYDLQDLVAEVTDAAREADSSDSVGVHDIVARHIQAYYEARQRLGVDTSSEQQSRVRSDDGRRGAWSDDIDWVTDESPPSTTREQLPW